MTDWENTLAGTLRRAAAPRRGPAFPPAPDGVGMVCPLTVPDVEHARWQRETFERAWSDVLPTQRTLAAAGWPGMMIYLPDTRPAVLKAMDAAVIAAGAVVEVAGPGETLSTVTRAAERMTEATKRQDAANPRATVQGPS